MDSFVNLVKQRSDWLAVSKVDQLTHSNASRKGRQEFLPRVDMLSNKFSRNADPDLFRTPTRIERLL